MVIVPSAAFAHGSKYFEFAPDTSSEHQAAYYDTPAQQFRPPNDFLGGVDLWLANSGSPGSATFQLQSASGGVLASKTVTIPEVAPVYGGTRFHVDFSSQAAVSVSNIYRLAILTDLPDLVLYQSSKFQILQHNTQNYPYYAIENAMLGDTITDFIFKFALYERQESAPPVIGNASTTNTSPWGTTISFTANEPIDFSVSYTPAGGAPTTIPFTGSFTICTELSAPCTVHLSVTPSTSYQYTISAKDEWGNVGIASGAFASDAAPVAPGGGSGEPNPPPASGGETSPPADGTSPPTTPPEPPQTPPPAPPGTSPPAPPPAGGPPPGAGTTPPPAGGSGGSAAQTPPAQPSGGGSSVPTPEKPVVAETVIDEDGKPALIIAWLAPAGPAPDSYHIEIYDADTDALVDEFDVAGDVHMVKIVERLSQGRYRIRIFAERDGGRTPVGDPIDIIISSEFAQLPPFDLQRLSFVLALIGILGAAGALGIITLIRRAKAKRATEQTTKRGFNLGK